MRIINRTGIVVSLMVIFALGGELCSFDRYDILVNDDKTTADQYNPRIALGNNGDFVVVWTDKRNGQSDIFFQTFDSTGAALGTNQKLNDDQSVAPQFEPAVDANLSSRFVSVWKDYRNGNYPFNPDIYFSRVDTFQTSGNFNITGQTSELTCESPDVGVFVNGSAVVVWSDYRNNNWDIYGQLVDSAGAFIGDNFKINSDAGTYQQHSPRVAAFDDGGFVVAWYDNRFGHDDIFFQRFDSAAGSIGQNIKVNDDAGSTRQAFPAVESDGNKRFFIAWIDWRNGSYPANPDIYLRRFDSSGEAAGFSVKVNENDGGRAQRDVSLCSDRMGNICVVWADSSSGQWDAMARIIDYEGKFDGSSFRIHDTAEERQLQPDVATDGYKFYFAWADRRNGNFDIYASIKQYNDPTLIPDPNSLEFVMEEGGILPPLQTITLSNAGYGELSWSAVPDADWLAVNQSSGITPDGFGVYIATDTLPYGTHYSNIRLIDLDHGDSTEVVSVKLTVTAPVMQVNPDTLYFKALAEVGNPESQQFQVFNTGSGVLSWTATENTGWFDIDKISGVQSEFIEVQIDISGLEYGDYMEPLIVSSAEAVNSPETAWVYLELVGNMPYLDARPDSIVLYGVIGESLSSEIEIVNPGAGTLHWTAVPGDDWVTIDIYSGSDYDTINIAIETVFMPSGDTSSEITVYDSASFNLAITIPVSLSLTSGDQVQFLNCNAMPGGIGVMPVYLSLDLPAKGGYIPFGFDYTLAALDSIVVNELNLPSFVNFQTGILSDSAGEIGFRVDDQMINDGIIPEADYHVADLFFTASDTGAFNYIDTLSSDSAGAYILGQSLNKKIPAITPGALIIGEPTSVSDGRNPLTPEAIKLGQNYPNPFNSATSIEIYLPQSSVVLCIIYNILGQKVCRLHDGPLPAGKHRFVWNGKLQDSSPAPSGIYFYSLAVGDFTDVKKMTVLK